MMKIQYWNLLCGKRNKKGLVFTIDSLLAAIIFFMIISASSFYILKSESEMSKVHISRVGSDVITLLENKGIFNGLDELAIENNLSDILPLNYKLNLNLTCEDKDLISSTTIVVGDEIPEKEFISSGRRFFVITDTSSINFCMVQYRIWQI